MYDNASVVVVAMNTSGVFTFIVGLLFKTQKFEVKKLLLSLTSVLGVYFLMDTTMVLNRGLLFGLLSALFYGIYSQYLKKEMNDQFQMREFIGFVGLWNTVLLWPVFFLLHYTDVEPFELPKQIWPILINAVFGTFISEYFWIKAIEISDPILVTLGIGLSVPLTIGVDILYMQHHIEWNVLVGAAIVVISFLLLEYEQPSDKDTEEVDAVCI